MRGLVQKWSLAMCVMAIALCACGCGGGTTTDAGRDSGRGLDGGGDGGDGGGMLDGSNDGGAPDAACTSHPAGGFTQVAASLVDQGFGDGLSMALDENDDPMFAYLAVEASVETGAPPAGCEPHSAPQGCDALYFTRWDACTGAFTPPVVVDPVLNYQGGNPGAQLISLAYDRSTHEIGIAYTKTLPTDPNWADTYDAIFLATRQVGQSTFAIQQVSDNNRWGGTDVSANDTPSLAMANGHLYMTFTATFGAPGCPAVDGASDWCLRFASSRATPPPSPDAGTDAGSADAGPPPPHYFDLSYVPYAAVLGGLLNPRADSTSIAVDSMGRPAIAAYQRPVTGYNTVLVYWRSDMPSAVTVADSNNVQNDLVSLTLAFEGTSPRVAGLLTRSSTGDYTATYVSSPDDGTTWNAAQPFMPSGGLGFYSSLATDGAGHEAFSSHFNGSTNTGCMGDDPFVTRSNNSGATWSGCALGSNNVDTDVNLSTAFGASRIAGKFVLAGAVDGNAAVLLDGGTGYSVVYYQEP